MSVCRLQIAHMYMRAEGCFENLPEVMVIHVGPLCCRISRYGFCWSAVLLENELSIGPGQCAGLGCQVA